MKEIIAIIQMDKINGTKRALIDMDVSSLTVRKVLGRGQGKVDFQLLKGAEQGYDEAIQQLGPGPRLIPKRMLTLVVPDDKVKAIIKTLMEVNQTQRPGDGKIFVCPVIDAVRVRTGQIGDDAIDDTVVQGDRP
jgi:nitrogen regulatory protein PII 2